MKIVVTKQMKSFYDAINNNFIKVPLFGDIVKFDGE